MQEFLLYELCDTGLPLLPSGTILKPYLEASLHPQMFEPDRLPPGESQRLCTADWFDSAARASLISLLVSPGNKMYTVRWMHDLSFLYIYDIETLILLLSNFVLFLLLHGVDAKWLKWQRCWTLGEKIWNLFRNSGQFDEMKIWDGQSESEWSLDILQSFYSRMHTFPFFMSLNCTDCVYTVIQGFLMDRRSSFAQRESLQPQAIVMLPHK